MFDEDIQGPDFLDMKPQDIERLFPKFGQKNRVNKLQNKFKHLTVSLQSKLNKYIWDTVRFKYASLIDLCLLS